MRKILILIILSVTSFITTAQSDVQAVFQSVSKCLLRGVRFSEDNLYNRLEYFSGLKKEQIILCFPKEFKNKNEGASYLMSVYKKMFLDAQSQKKEAKKYQEINFLS